jgi:hypothetical protein
MIAKKSDVNTCFSGSLGLAGRQDEGFLSILVYQTGILQLYIERRSGSRHLHTNDHPLLVLVPHTK